MLVTCLLLVLQASTSASDQCAEGVWSQPSEGQPLKVRAARTSLVGKQKQRESLVESWLRSACSVQTVMHSCYAHGDFRRAQELENRHWVAKRPQCMPYTSGRLLEFSKLFFLQTFPQHFFNGYFDFVERSDEIDKRCHPQGSNTTTDWKNQAADLALGGAVEILRVAKELKSQHDGHLEANSKLIKMHVADCTHRCFPNGVFSYAATVLLNAL